jgi:polyphosphate kinase
MNRPSRPDETGLGDPALFVNRELSWLEFNARVLDEARDPQNPLLERLKFLSIFASNLDEFFMIRVANLKEVEAAGVEDPAPDGLTADETLDAISARCHALMDEHAHILHREVRPALEQQGVHVVRWADLDDGERARMTELFQNEIFPVLTPTAVDPSHPFPHLTNLALNLVVTFAPEPDVPIPFAIVSLPPVLDALFNVSQAPGDHRLLPLQELVREHIDELFPGLDIVGVGLFRVTRNSDLALEEQEVENLLQDLERELRARTRRRAVRLEVECDVPDPVVATLAAALQLPERKIYRMPSLLQAGSLMRLYGMPQLRALRDPPFNPRLAPAMATPDSIFRVLRHRDLLLHHPYESFSTVVEFVHAAAHDPKTLAIKLTLYRTGGDSVIIQALKEAAQNGKQVTAVVELKARFDERNNIVWARELEAAGCHVTYGIVGLKTHCKAAMVVRREPRGVRTYVHLSTGNYNSSTARLYTDLGFMTSDPALADDVAQLFNLLTGYSARNIQNVLDDRAPEPEFGKLAISPFSVHEQLVQLIEDEIRLHTPENPGLIEAKFNSLVEPTLIRSLYRASRAGVQIRLCVRGICCLRPGVPGVSDNIRVISVVDRFLEHPRIFRFRHGGEERIYLSSADWMPRNMFRRIESLFPIDAPELKRRVIDEILAITFADNVKARELNADGTWTRVQPEPGAPRVRSQQRFIELARKVGLKWAPHDVAVRQATRRRTLARRAARGSH